MRLASRRVSVAALTLVVGALALMPVFGHTAEDKPWGPYLRDKKGEAKPLPEKLDKIKDEEWLKIAYTDYHSIKPRLAIYLPPLQNDQVDPNQMNSDIGKLLVLYSKRDPKQPDGSDGVEVQLRQALGATNRFRMVEGSSSADKILNEQDFGASGRVSGASAAKLGRITGSQYIAKVKLIEINPEKEAKSIGIAAGVLCFFAATTVKRAFGYDDSLDAFGVHCIGGIVGALLTGVFHAQSLGGPGMVPDWTTAAMATNPDGILAQVWIQAKGVLLTIVWSGVVAFIAFKIADLTVGLRVTEEQEREGLDISAHGETAYSR